MGIDCINEKVKVVQICIAKLINKVPEGYSRSADKLRDWLLETPPEVKQFLMKDNPLKFIQPKETIDDQEIIQVNIRFGNYSMMQKASQFGATSKMLSQLGKKHFDNDEDKLLNSVWK